MCRCTAGAGGCGRQVHPAAPKASGVRRPGPQRVQPGARRHEAVHERLEGRQGDGRRPGRRRNTLTDLSQGGLGIDGMIPGKFIV